MEKDLNKNNLNVEVFFSGYVSHMKKIRNFSVSEFGPVNKFTLK